MSEKSDDIKQLFSHLGLNPSDYQEIRNAPSAGATMTDAPRRWSLLQAISAPSSVASVAPAARVMPSLAPAVTPAVVPSAPTPPTPSQWAEILPGLAPAPSTSTSAPAPAPEAPVSAADGLKSLFQSVREPVPTAPLPSAPSSQPSLSPMTGEQAADLLYRELRGGAQTLAARPPPPPVTPPWAGYDPEQETRHAPTPATPGRVAAPQNPPPPPAPAAVAAPTRLVLPLATEPMPEMPRPLAPPRPLLSPAPTPAVAAAPPRTPPPAPAPIRAEAAPAAATGLIAAFRRLSEPEPPRAAASGRLRLNYRLPHSNAGGASKDERLGDVLKRISGHNGETR